MRFLNSEVGLYESPSAKPRLVDSRPTGESGSNILLRMESLLRVNWNPEHGWKGREEGRPHGSLQPSLLFLLFFKNTPHVPI